MPPSWCYLKFLTSTLQAHHSSLVYTNEAKISCDTANGFWIFKNLHLHHTWIKLSYINFSLIQPDFPFGNQFPLFISCCDSKIAVPFYVSEGFDCFLHSSQILLQKILLIFVSILFFFLESMVISNACIYQGDQRNDYARTSLPPTERITLSKCPCWTFMLRSCPRGW